ncbi:MAG: VanW family protein [Clostridia bacterium]
MNKKKGKLFNINAIPTIKSKKNIIAFVMMTITIIVISGVVFTLFNITNRKVYSNVYLSGKNVSKYTANELEKYIKEQQSKIEKKSKVIIRQEDKEIDNLIPSEIDFEIDIAKTKKNVYDFGRNKNIFENNLDILKAMFKKKNIDIAYKYDELKLENKIQMLTQSLENKVVDDKYEVDEENFKLIITKGHKGQTINVVDTKKHVLNALKKGEIIEHKLNVVSAVPKQLDVEMTHKNIKRDFVNAEIKKENGKMKFIKEVYGLDFLKQELNEILKKPENLGEGAIIKFDLKVAAPMVKYKDIAWNKFDDVLGSMTTVFPAGNINRGTNLSVSLSYLNDKIIMPGEVFSFNKNVGEPSFEKGYKEAAAFSKKDVVNEVGGGICQSVSTLYNAALYANLEIVSRASHAMPVGYVQPSLDATMYYPYLDFKFKNTKNFPIKIKTSFSWAGSMNISILGTKEEDDVDIILESEKITTLPYTTKTVVDSGLEPEQKLIKQNGIDGYTSRSYKIVKKDGKLISKTLISNDTYKPTQKVILQGPNAKKTDETEEIKSE